MKQLLFLLLFPCLALAQYPGNGNQKITLGEQTTADGLVWRGIRADTTSKIVPFSDTSAYIILDTVEKTLWLYKAGQIPKWQQVGGSTLDTATMLSPYWRSGRFSGVLPVANGGTNTSTLTANKVMVGNGTNGVLTPLNLSWDNANGYLGIGADPNSLLYVYKDHNSKSEITVVNPSTGGSAFSQMTVANSLATTDVAGFQLRGKNFGNICYIFTSTGIANGMGFITQATGAPIDFLTEDTNRMRITGAGEVWIGYTADNGAYPLQVNGQIFATNATIATSDEKFKENITPLNKGIEIVNKLKPVTFNFISDTKNNFSEYEEVGFIAQDVDRALSTESFAKSIVKAADDSEPTSTMGLATQNLIPILVKAIQEQQALIKALEQRIINLENK